MTASDPNLVTLGWNEWAALPDLGIAALRVKLDTGALNSALQADAIESFDNNGEPWLSFDVHPLRRNPEVCFRAQARQVGERAVKSSSGMAQERYFIETRLCLAGHSYPIITSLANRRELQFPMLIGRSALAGHFLVDSERRYSQGQWGRRHARAMRRAAPTPTQGSDQ